MRTHTNMYPYRTTHAHAITPKHTPTYVVDVRVRAHVHTESDTDTQQAGCTSPVHTKYHGNVARNLLRAISQPHASTS